MRTLKEILENFHDSALAKLTEDEINLESLKGRTKDTKPGEDSDKLQEGITVKETNVKRIKSVVEIIERRLAEQPKSPKLEPVKPSPSPGNKIENAN